MRRLQARVALDGLIYPEGVRWHAGRLWFSDILDRKVYAYDPSANRVEVVAETDDLPSGLGFTPDGRLLIATMRRRQLLRLDPHGLTLVADLAGGCQLMNDMVVDGEGRAWLDADFGEGRGGVILVEPGGRWRVVAEDMVSPNGLAVSADGRTLLVNDLFANRIRAFDIAPSGDLLRPRVFADLGESSPDGLCLDAEGAAWVGQPFQARFRRIREGGEVTHEIATAGRWALAPVLGGADRRTLYLCTAKVTIEKIAALLEDPRNARDECRGWIETAEAEAPGAGWP
jgi:sugar lactone lactonase YvrE